MTRGSEHASRELEGYGVDVATFRRLQAELGLQLAGAIELGEG